MLLKNVLAVCAVLAAGTALAEDPPVTDTQRERCLWADRIDGFSEASRDSVVLHQGMRRFRATFATPCIGIEWAMTLRATSAMACFGEGDRIEFSDMGGSARASCIVSALEYLPR